MSLIQEINRTETEKNKTKQVAINIDNKLVELGGEQATDLADVPNKMEVMVKTQYKRVAIGNTTLNERENMSGIYIPLNLNFKPSRLIVSFDRVGLEYTSGRKNLTLDTGYNNGTYEQDRVYCKINTVDESRFKVTFYGGTIKGNCVWIAIE